MAGCRLKRIRDCERKSHSLIYATEKLYSSDGWLKKPIKTIQDLMPFFSEYTALRVLDLGCGVGRNSIYIADICREKQCVVDCVDLLEIAIEKLKGYALENKVEQMINGVVKSIEEYEIMPDTYDLILAVSALEHVEDEVYFFNKLVEIRDGVKENGIVCLVVNSEVRERDAKTKEELEPQFEVNLPTVKLLAYLEDVFCGFKIIKRSVKNQVYHIPRDKVESELSTRVVTFVAQRGVLSL